MKKSIALTIACFMLCLNTLSSQFEFGVKMGIHSFDLSNPTDIIFSDNNSISFNDAKMGFQGGVYTKFELGAISLEPRLMLHSSTVEYTFNGDNGGILNSIREETFTNLDIPVLFGFDVLFVRALVGPVAHLNLNTTSDLFDISGYDERFDTATYGFRAGFCISLGKVDLSLEYEGNFSRFGDHITIGGEEFSFGERPSRLIFNLGIPLI